MVVVRRYFKFVMKLISFNLKRNFILKMTSFIIIFNLQLSGLQEWTEEDFNSFYDRKFFYLIITYCMLPYLTYFHFETIFNTTRVSNRVYIIMKYDFELINGY